MKTAAVDIKEFFRPILGTRPWKVKPGVGSFLTFEFGTRTKSHGHIHGKWHLWIYLSNWVLFRGQRQLVSSDTDRKVIAPVVRRVENAILDEIALDVASKTTTFVFDDFRLVVAPADYLNKPEERDVFWMFFMPNNEVLSVGPAGIGLEEAHKKVHVKA